MTENIGVIIGTGVIALFLTLAGMAWHDNFAIVFAPITACLFGLFVGGSLMKDG